MRVSYSPGHEWLPIAREADAGKKGFLPEYDVDVNVDGRRNGMCVVKVDTQHCNNTNQRAANAKLLQANDHWFLNYSFIPANWATFNASLWMVLNKPRS